MIQSPSVAIIIVNWNGKADTLACLASLRQDSYENKRIIIVDNASRDDSVAAIRTAYPEVDILAQTANLGFTGGNNIAIEYALSSEAQYVYLLNNDTIVEPDALSRLVAAAEANPDFGLLTPVIHYHEPAQAIWFGGSRINLSEGIAVHDNSHPPHPTDPLIEVPWASGCAMLARGELMQTLGGFDNRFFLNCEDIDLCLRIKNMDLKIGMVPGARIEHKVGRAFAVASGVGVYYHTRNSLLLVRLHGEKSYWHAVCKIITLRLRESLRMIKNRRTLSLDPLPTTLAAIQDHFLQRYGPRRPVNP